MFTTTENAGDDAHGLFRLVLLWEEFKTWLSNATGLSHHDYHLLLGVLLTLALTRLLRRPLGAWTPLMIVFGLEMVNEAFDFIRYYVAGYPWGPMPMLVDIALTMLPPLAITIAARWDRGNKDGAPAGQRA